MLSVSTAFGSNSRRIAWIAWIRGSEIHEAAYRSLGADPIRDDPLVEPVLDRHDEALWAEHLLEIIKSGLGVMGLYAKEDGLYTPLDLSRVQARRADREVRDGTRDMETVTTDRLDVRLVGVYEDRTMPGSDQPGPDRSAHGSRAPHVDRVQAAHATLRLRGQRLHARDPFKADDRMNDLLG